jgi:hypothetical protein
MTLRLKALKDFWVSTASKTGGMGRKTLEALIPDEVLKNSLFIGSFYDVARKVEALTEEAGKAESKEFLLKKGGGHIIDLAATPVTGLPITLWSALLSDGCKVASWTLRTAAKSADSEDELMIARLINVAAGGIDHAGSLSDSMFRFFDTPGKAEAGAMVESSFAMLEYAKENSELLGKEIVRDAQELYRLSQGIAEGGSKIENTEVQREFIEKSSRLIGALCAKAGEMGGDLKAFILAPNKENFVALSLQLEKSFKKAPLFFYKEIILLLRRSPEFIKYLPRADREILAMAKIIKGLSHETAGKMTQYMEHYKLDSSRDRR